MDFSSCKICYFAGNLAADTGIFSGRHDFRGLGSWWHVSQGVDPNGFHGTLFEQVRTSPDPDFTAAGGRGSQDIAVGELNSALLDAFEALHLEVTADIRNGPAFIIWDSGKGGSLHRIGDGLLTGGHFQFRDD